MIPANQSHSRHFRMAAKPLRNLLTQCPYFVAEISEAQAGNRTGPKGQWAGDKAGVRTPLFPSPLPWASLPTKALTPGPVSPRARQWSMFVCPLNREESLCSTTWQGLPSSGVRAPHRPPRVGKALEHSRHNGPGIPHGSGKGVGPGENAE